MGARKRPDKTDPRELAKQRQQDDRVRRARASYASISAEHFGKCADLAREVGADPADVIDEFTERAGARQFCGNVSRQEAESLAWLDTLARYERQKRIA